MAVLEKELIGIGHFTKAYRSNGMVELVSNDPIKECMSMGWFPESRLFPEMGPGDYYGDGKKKYLMEFYEQPRSIKSRLCEHDWDLYVCLKTIFNEFDRPVNNHMLSDSWHKAFDTLPDRFADEIEDLHLALDACCNYGSDICFEISPRNIAVRGDKLILLDCFFVLSSL